MCSASPLYSGIPKENQESSALDPLNSGLMKTGRDTVILASWPALAESVGATGQERMLNHDKEARKGGRQE